MNWRRTDMEGEAIDTSVIQKAIAQSVPEPNDEDFSDEGEDDVDARPTSTQHAMQTLQVITPLFVVHCFLHTFDFHCNIGVKFCRPS